MLTAPFEFGMDEVQHWLQEHEEGAELVEVSEQAGGNKGMQGHVWTGAFNYFGTNGFIEMLELVEFRKPEAVKLLVKEEHDEVFTDKTPKLTWSLTKPTLLVYPTKEEATAAAADIRPLVNKQKFISFSFLWYDFWIGFYYDRDNRAVYICPLPCCVIKIKLRGMIQCQKRKKQE